MGSCREGYYSVFFLSVQWKIRGVTVSYHVQWPVMLLFSVQLPATLHTITHVIIILTGFIYCSPEFTWQGLPNYSQRKKIFWLRVVTHKFDFSLFKIMGHQGKKNPRKQTKPNKTKQRKKTLPTLLVLTFPSKPARGQIQHSFVPVC